MAAGDAGYESVHEKAGTRGFRDPACRFQTRVQAGIIAEQDDRIVRVAQSGCDLCDPAVVDGLERGGRDRRQDIGFLVGPGAVGREDKTGDAAFRTVGLAHGLHSHGGDLGGRADAADPA